MEVKIDKEFENLIDPLTPEEYKTLKNSIEKEGLRDPLIIWEEEDILLDGHNRYKICQECGIEIKNRGLSFTDREHAIDWIMANQLGRRNITPNQKIYLMGKQYNLKKGMRGGDRKSESAKSKGQNEPLISVKKDLAEKNHVSESKIKRAGKYAEAVDTVSALSDNPIEQRRDILSGKFKLSQKDLTKIADIAKEDEAKAKKYFEEIKAGLPEKKKRDHSHKKIAVKLPISIYDSIKELQKEKEKAGEKSSISEILQEILQNIKINDLKKSDGDVTKNIKEKSKTESNVSPYSNDIVLVEESIRETLDRVNKMVIEMDEKFPGDYKKCAAKLNEKGQLKPVPGGYQKWDETSFETVIENARGGLKRRQEKDEIAGKTFN